jgi:hypothetical protein
MIKRGEVAILSYAPDGQMPHQLRGLWGTDYGGGLYKPGRLPKLQEKGARIMVVAPYLSRSDKDDVGLPEKVVRCRDWAEGLKEVKGKMARTLRWEFTPTLLYGCSTRLRDGSLKGFLMPSSMNCRKGPKSMVLAITGFYVPWPSP